MNQVYSNDFDEGSTPILLQILNELKGLINCSVSSLEINRKKYGFLIVSAGIEIY